MSSPPLLGRLRSNNPLIDLRNADAEAVADLSVFAQVDEALAAFGRARNLRVWVLHEAASRWTRDADLARRAMRALYDCGPGRAEEGVVDAAVLAGSAKDNRALIYLLRSTGVAPFPVRPAGGLPLHEVDLGEGLWAGMVPPPSPGNEPREAVLASLFSQLDEAKSHGDKAAVDAAEAAIAEHVGLALKA